jgi:Fe2+ transport system protein B
MKLAILVVALSMATVSTANACRTSGPPGPDTCAAAADEMMRRIHQQELQRIERERQLLRERAKLEAERRQLEDEQIRLRTEEAKRRETLRQIEEAERTRRAQAEARERADRIARQEEARRQEAERKQAEQRAAEEERKRQREKDIADLLGKGVSQGEALGIALGMLVAMFGAAFKAGYPKMGGLVAIAVPAITFAVYLKTGIQLKPDITLAEWPLFTPLLGGAVVVALMYKFQA